jgi:hypothetical protein
MSPAQPRRQHYHFAHQVLPGLLFSNPERFFQTLAQDGPGFLEFAWQRSAEPPRGAELSRPNPGSPPDGLALRLEQLDPQTRLALITLPPPQAMTEAYFAAAIYHPAAQPDDAPLLRYLTLEYSMDPATQRPLTMLGEWDSSQPIHRNWGGGPPPELDAFRSAVLALLQGAAHAH